MSKLELQQTKEFKVLLRQAKNLVETINGFLNSDVSDTSKYTSYKTMANIYNMLSKELLKINKINVIGTVYDLENMPGIYDTTWITQKEILESVLISSKMLVSAIEGNLDFIDDEIDNLFNFIYKKLRATIFGLPQKEKEIQNSLESLLLGRGMNKGIDYDRECGKFMFSGREYIPDFIIPKLKLCIEVKLLKDLKRKSKTIEEINADITAYSKEYERILFVIYDVGIIRDEVEFKRDIESFDNVKVVIVKH